LILELDNCYFVSVLSRNNISISYLALNGFIFMIEGKYYFFIIMVFFYESSNYTNSLYIIDFEMPMFNINYKKNRLDNQYHLYL
jgi:hypothetical protein